MSESPEPATTAPAKKAAAAPAEAEVSGGTVTEEGQPEEVTQPAEPEA